MRSRAHLGSHPIHPMLVGFPIALWISAFILDCVGVATADARYWQAGFFVVIGGCIGAAAAAVPGVIDLFSVVPERSSAKRRGLLHGGLNSLILLLFVAMAAYRGSAEAQPTALALLLEGIGVAGLAVSGWLGATLVFRNQIGVDHRYAGGGKWKSRVIDSWDRPVCNVAELADGQMMSAEIAGHSIVVGRSSDGVFAFDNHCTHRGGPLADGALVGCTVQCPWHGSQFDIKSGRVVAPPAQSKVATYLVQVRGGEVYVHQPGKDHEQKVA